MDINTLRSIVTVLAFACFVGIVLWAWSKRNQDRFEDAARLPLAPGCEVTLEANPGTFEKDRFRAFRAAGVTRLSVGVQSFNDRHLKALGRVHDRAQAPAEHLGRLDRLDAGDRARGEMAQDRRRIERHRVR